MTSPDQGGSGAVQHNHTLLPDRDVFVSDCPACVAEEAGGSGAGSTVGEDDDPLNDPYLGLPASLSVLQNELNKCGLPSEVRTPLARRITELREGVINLQQTLLRERKTDIWVADAWVSRAALDAARSEIERQTEELNDLDTKLGAALKALGLEHADLAHSHIEALERVADVVRKCWNTSSWCPPEIGEALAALDAAQATAEPEKATEPSP